MRRRWAARVLAGADMADVHVINYLIKKAAEMHISENHGEDRWWDNYWQ